MCQFVYTDDSELPHILRLTFLLADHCHHSSHRVSTAGGRLTWRIRLCHVQTFRQATAIRLRIDHVPYRHRCRGVGEQLQDTTYWPSATRIWCLCVRESARRYRPRSLSCARARHPRCIFQLLLRCSYRTWHSYCWFVQSQAIS